MAMVQCTTPNEKSNVVNEPEVLVVPSSTASSLDTTAVYTEEPAIEEPEVATKKEVTPTVTPAAKKPAVVAKNTTNKPKTSTTKPANTTPVPKVPAVVEPTPAPTPVVEKKAEPAAPAPTPKQPATKVANFTLKTTKAVVQGSSTLHDWESKITKVEGKGSFQTKDGELVALKDVEIKMDVKGIVSKEGKKMDDKTYETLKSDKHPNIVYTFSSAAVKVDASKAVTIEASGNLTMAGVTKPVSLKATGKELSNGDLQLSVSEKINMTDYKMDPPVMMLGTIKVGKDVTVKFDFVLEKK